MSLSTNLSPFAAAILLFIDSSHVSKTASDVNYLFFGSYTKPGSQGSLCTYMTSSGPLNIQQNGSKHGCAWNESYLVRAFLTFNESFQIVFWVPFAARAWPEIITERMPAT